MKNKRLIFIGGSIGLVGLIGFCYLRRKNEMGNNTEHMPNSLVGNTTGKNTTNTVQETLKRTTVTNRDKNSLQNIIKAMSPEEQEALLEVIPVSLCMKRIQAELDHAREFETMIKKAYEMK